MLKLFGIFLIISISCWHAKADTYNCLLFDDLFLFQKGNTSVMQKTSKATKTTLKKSVTTTDKDKGDTSAVKVPEFQIKGKNLLKHATVLSAAFSGRSTSNTDVDLIIANIAKFQYNAYRTRVEGAYFFKNYLSMGIALEYSQLNMTLKANIMNIQDRELQVGSRSYAFLPFIKHHVPVSRNHSIYITNQIELQYNNISEAHETPITDKRNSDNIILERQFIERHKFGLAIRPGVLVFLQPHFAFEVNISVLGVGYQSENIAYVYPEHNMPSEEQTKQKVQNKSSFLNAKFDLLNVGFGISYYF